MTFAKVDDLINSLSVQPNGTYDRSAQKAAKKRLYIIVGDHIAQQKSCLKLIYDLIYYWWDILSISLIEI
jgi:hypothetical protein